MKINIKIFLIFTFLFISKSSLAFSYSLEDYAKNPFGNVLFIRHTLAPGFGDPQSFDLNDCSTQRNLNKEGIQQAFSIGEKIKVTGIKFIKIFSSQWCRCMETAEHFNLGEITVEPGLNSFFQGFVPKDKTLSILQKRLESIEESQQLVLMVTHQVTIAAVTGINVPSGGAVAFNTNSGESKEVMILDY
tara:strand:- start:904 stop:1470 length:567 start_codon:yes stop_codon:yes gene_type:complete